jgi:hypothetical protein
VAAAGKRDLAGDRRENGFDLSSEPEKHRDGNDGNESQYQGVLDKGLALGSPFSPAGHSFEIHLSNPIFLN